MTTDWPQARFIESRWEHSNSSMGTWSYAITDEAMRDMKISTRPLDGGNSGVKNVSSVGPRRKRWIRPLLLGHGRCTTLERRTMMEGSKMIEWRLSDCRYLTSSDERIDRASTYATWESKCKRSMITVYWTIDCDVDEDWVLLNVKSMVLKGSTYLCSLSAASDKWNSDSHFYNSS